MFNILHIMDMDAFPTPLLRDGLDELEVAALLLLPALVPVPVAASVHPSSSSFCFFLPTCSVKQLHAKPERAAGRIAKPLRTRSQGVELDADGTREKLPS